MRRLVRLCLALLLAIVSSGVMSYAQSVSVVYNFGSGALDPDQPFYAGVIAQGQDGNLYSAGEVGSVYGGGATFRLTPSGTLTTLYSFTKGSDGGSPSGGLTLGSDGNLYGTTYSGGFFGGAPFGTVFVMTPNGVLTTLYTFTDGSDGALSEAPPIEGADGNFYGTTCVGCSPIATGYGSIYRITPAGDFAVLYDFDLTHGYEPMAPLTLGTDGNFYGTAAAGGTASCLCGVIFKMTPAGALSVLYNFDRVHGSGPIAPLIQGSDGNFYGTTLSGGANNDGTVFKITPAGKLTVLHSMNDNNGEGAGPTAGLVQATDGNFYGANTIGGTPSANCPAGCGTVFKMTRKGVFSVLYNFDLTTGQLPYSSLFQHTNGLIYGMTQLGGTGSVSCSPDQCGVLYAVNISAHPFVSLLPAFGAAGQTIGILGQGFTGATKVRFAGGAATFTVVSDNYLTATVPNGAKTGFVTVKTPGGTLKSNKKFLRE